ncbi:MAG TPA: SDR family NAD(P)-dependent oxidoreductase, partial [Vicinamibacterales bacterium]
MSDSIASFYRDRSVLITGASSGIGAALARHLGHAGAKLTLAARRAELLNGLSEQIAAGGAAAPLAAACDVTRDGDLEGVVASAVRRWGKL